MRHDGRCNRWCFSQSHKGSSRIQSRFSFHWHPSSLKVLSDQSGLIPRCQVLVPLPHIWTYRVHDLHGLRLKMTLRGRISTPSVRSIELHTPSNCPSSSFLM